MTLDAAMEKLADAWSENEKLKAVLRAIVAAVDEQPDIDPTAALHRAMSDAKSWLQTNT